MFYVLHGDEEYLRSEEIARAKAQVASGGLGELNVVRLDGRRLALADLFAACNTVPFLGERRLVIVENLLQRYDEVEKPRRGKGSGASVKGGQAGSERSGGAGDDASRLVDYLPQLPATTRLILVENRTLSPHNPVLRFAQECQGGYVREFRLPDQESLQTWIQRRVKDKGGQIGREAVKQLASYFAHQESSPSLRLLDLELEKLVAYAGYGREIAPSDIQLQVRWAQEEDVFALVDALGGGSRQQAMRLLRGRLASGDNELYLLTMFARQFRLLLAATDLAQQGKGVDEIGVQLGIRHRFVTEKLLKQGRRFSLPTLERIQRGILDADQCIKTGRMIGPLALELLVVGICAQRRG